MRKPYPLYLLLVFLLFSQPGIAQEELSKYFPEIKILESNIPAEGYFFMASKGLSGENAEHYIAIVDNIGEPVFFRLMPKPSLGMRLLKDGTIAYLHGAPRKIFIMDEMLTVIDTINTIGGKLDGHDYDIDDNGDYHRFVFSQYNRTVDMSELFTGGNTEAEINEVKIQELDRENNLIKTVKTESIFQILDGDDASPYLDFTESSLDYAHVNGIAVYSDSSYIISSRHMNEITNIDRRTGEIIWRLGGKNNQFTFLNDSLGFNHQHTPRRTQNGNLLLFDNGNLRDSTFSSALEYQLDEENMTASLVARYRRNPDVFVPRNGFVQRVHNGNTIAEWGDFGPSLTEFHPNGTVAIELDMTDHSYSPRTAKYQWKTKVFETSVEAVNFGMYDGETAIEKIIQLTNNCDTLMHITGYSTRSNHYKITTTLPLMLEPGLATDLTIEFTPSDTEIGYLKDILTIYSESEVQRIARQVLLEGSQADVIAPVINILPDSANTPVETKITLAFSGPVRKTNGEEIQAAELATLISLYKEANNSLPTSFTAVINTDRTEITLTPDSPLEYNTDYVVNVDVDLSDYSSNRLLFDPGTFKTASLTNNSPLRQDISFEVYPNPSTGILQIRTGLNEAAMIKLYSIQGSLLFDKFTSHPDNFTLDLSSFPKGIYFLLLDSGNSPYLGKKIILQ